MNNSGYNPKETPDTYPPMEMRKSSANRNYSQNRRRPGSTQRSQPEHRPQFHSPFRAPETKHGNPSVVISPPPESRRNNTMSNFLSSLDIAEDKMIVLAVIFVLLSQGADTMLIIALLYLII